MVKSSKDQTSSQQTLESSSKYRIKFNYGYRVERRGFFYDWEEVKRYKHGIYMEWTFHSLKEAEDWIKEQLAFEKRLEEADIANKKKAEEFGVRYY